MEIRELNEGDLGSLIKLYEQLDGRNGAFAVEDARTIWISNILVRLKILLKGRRLFQPVSVQLFQILQDLVGQSVL